MEIDVVDLLHLMLEHLGLHHRVEQDLVSTFQGRQDIHTFHQIRHAYIVMTLCLGLAGFQEFFVQQVVGVLRIESNVVRIVGVGMNPDSILAAFEDTAQNGCQRTRAQLGVSHRQHIGLQ